MKDLIIHYAGYGRNGSLKKVTKVLRKRISKNGRLNITVINTELGIHPYPGQEKELWVLYTFNGVTKFEKIKEGDDLIIPNLVIPIVKTSIFGKIFNRKR